MFTGIVERTGAVVGVTDDEAGRRVQVAAGFDDLDAGQSIAISGACLTVERYTTDYFEVFCSTETLKRTTLDSLAEDDSVNVERALRADDRLDGHFVQGHVDATAEVREIESVGEDWRFAFSLPDAIARYVVEKGSITVDGISLTVANLHEAGFSTAIIPETYERTTLQLADVGDRVNLEVDVIAKYVERLTDGYR